MKLPTTNPNTLLSAHHVTLNYGARAVLDRVSLEILPRQITTIIGPNGSGKTTLLRVLLGLQEPDTGSVTRAPGLRIGYMPQKITVDPVLPITVEWFLNLYAPSPAGRKAPAQDLLEDPVLSPLAIHRIRHSRLQDLSGGELQRVWLARALLQKPQLLVLDEPVQGVDVTGQAALYELIASIRNETGCAVLMVSHDLHLVMSATDEVICLNHHVCCAGHPHSVRSDPAFVALFGAHVADALAVYTHHHDHQHS